MTMIDNDTNSGIITNDRIHQILSQAIEINHKAVLAFQQNQFHTAGIAFRQVLVDIRAISACPNLSMMLASESPYSSISSLCIETAAIASIDDMTVSYLDGTVAFFGYAFDFHTKDSSYINTTSFLPLTCDSCEICETKKGSTVANVMTAFTSTVLFNLALVFHCMGCIVHVHGSQESKRFLHQAARLYTVFHQIYDDAAVALIFPSLSITIQLAALNNFALVQQQLNHDDALQDSLVQFKDVYRSWCYRERKVHQEDQSWHVFMRTLLLIQWLYKQAAPAA
jgi:hypothetical protein